MNSCCFWSRKTIWHHHVVRLLTGPKLRVFIVTQCSKSMIIKWSKVHAHWFLKWIQAARIYLCSCFSAQLWIMFQNYVFEVWQMSFGEEIWLFWIHFQKCLFLDLPKDYQVGVTRLPKNKKFKQKIGRQGFLFGDQNFTKRRPSFIIFQKNRFSTLIETPGFLFFFGGGVVWGVANFRNRLLDKKLLNNPT